MRATSIFGVLIPATISFLLASASPAPHTVQDRFPQAQEQDVFITQQTSLNAITVMNRYYSQTQGQWSPQVAWWLTGNALQAVLDYTNRTGDQTFLPQALHIINSQKGVQPHWPQGAGYFRASSTDDTAWWALAMVRMYDITGDESYLDIATLDEDYIFSFWNGSWCGGGIIQELDPAKGRYKNAISNTLYIKLAASLARRRPAQERFLRRSLQALDWFMGSGMINSENLVNDGISEDCRNNGQPTWTYNQGVILGALVELSRVTGNASYLEPARRIADAVVASRDLALEGILREPCEARNNCNGDQATFKGIFARNLAELDAALDGRYREFLTRNAQSASTFGRDVFGNYGVRWAGPYDGLSSISSQSSAVGLLVAAL